MFNKNENIIEKIVDIKTKINTLLISILILILPLNQQYHLRPFPSVDGFIIDYLILKVSIPELLLILIFILNLSYFLKSLHVIFKEKSLLLLVAVIMVSIVKSRYLGLALYENLLLLVCIFMAYFFYRNLHLINLKLLENSLKFWIIALTILGFFQFYTQSSVFNNYALTGEFPYSEDYYHIKQKNLFLGDFIPPYSIFSHSNIFGAYLIFAVFLLFLISKVNPFLYLLVLIDLIVIGSVACLLAYTVFLITMGLNSVYLKKLLIAIFLSSVGIYFYFSYSVFNFKNDYSIYRRLYMFDLSSNYFIENPSTFLFGGGYYNYFYLVRAELYNYELVRFFQPPHFLPILLIWQYGVGLILLLIYLIYKYFDKLSTNFLRFLIIFLLLSSFDHYLFTNHQIKVLILFIIPYSLIIKNSI